MTSTIVYYKLHVNVNPKIDSRRELESILLNQYTLEQVYITYISRASCIFFSLFGVDERMRLELLVSHDARVPF